MMMMKCDRCGKIYEKNEGIPIGDNKKMIGLGYIYKDKWGSDWKSTRDLCDDCLNAFVLFMNEERENI